MKKLERLTAYLQVTAQNYDFATKKTTYFQNKNGTTSYSLTTQVVNMDKWTPDVVKTRQEKLLQLFEKKWDLKIEKDDNAPANQKLLFHIAIRGCNATGYPDDNSKFVVVRGRSANGPREWTTLDGRQYGKVIGR